MIPMWTHTHTSEPHLPNFCVQQQMLLLQLQCAQLETMFHHKRCSFFAPRADSMKTRGCWKRYIFNKKNRPSATIGSWLYCRCDKIPLVHCIFESVFWVSYSVFIKFLEEFEEVFLLERECLPNSPFGLEFFFFFQYVWKNPVIYYMALFEINFAHAGGAS